MLSIPNNIRRELRIELKCSLINATAYFPIMYTFEIFRIFFYSDAVTSCFQILNILRFDDKSVIQNKLFSRNKTYCSYERYHGQLQTFDPFLR